MRCCVAFRFLLNVVFVFETADCVSYSLAREKALLLGSRSNTTRVVFLGDLLVGDSYKGTRKTPVALSPGYSLSALEPILDAAKPDLFVANLEGPILRHQYAGDKQKKWRHRMKPEDAKWMIERLQKAGPVAMTLANNHMLDYGAGGLADTLAELQRLRLDALGVQVAGEHPPAVKAQGSGRQVVVLAAANDNFLGGHEDWFQWQDMVSQNSSQGERTDPARARILDAYSDSFLTSIRSARRTFGNALLVVTVHWGKNYAASSGDEQRLWGRRYVDAGADLVVGHGAHWLLEMERYGDAAIVYDIGNSVFLSPGRYEANRQSQVAGGPFSLVLAVDSSASATTLHLCPILSDNKVTRFQPRPLTPGQFDDFAKLYEDKSINVTDWRQSTLGDASCLLTTVPARNQRPGAPRRQLQVRKF